MASTDRTSWNTQTTNEFVRISVEFFLLIEKYIKQDTISFTPYVKYAFHYTYFHETQKE